MPLLARYTVGAFIEPGIAKDDPTALALEREVTDEKIPRYLAAKDMTLDLGGGAALRIFYPDHDVSRLRPNFDNEGSVVARLSYGGFSALFTGDAPQDVEDKLEAGEGGALRSTILKVGHHGSRLSTSARFVAAVRPSLAVISVGADNRYGHPSPEALKVLEDAGVPVLRTDLEGTLIFRSDGENFSRVR